MCWCLRVYSTVLHNLFLRFFTNITNVIHNNNNNNNNNNNRCCCCCCCCNYGKHKRITMKTGSLESQQLRDSCASNIMEMEALTTDLQHEYVIIDEIDADYVEIQSRKIETESYYLIVDRKTAEDILLTCQIDGACLVRPYKESDISIKYILSIYAQKQYFHLFIRHIGSKQDGLYAIGQKKPNEKLFISPSDIIDFYNDHPLHCTNKNITLSLLLRPIKI